MRTRAALVAAATLTGLLAAPTSAAVVAETCQGLPATIVANPRGTTVGTEGADVIVGHQATIDARGGNDVICLDSGEVAAGDGNDSILVTGTDRDNSVSASLGAGDDRYVGGRASDFIFDEIDIASPGSDTISTGAGADIVTSASGAPYHLVVDLGAGEDLLNLDAQDAGSSAQVQGGTGPDELSFRGDSADFAFDLGTGAVTRSGVHTASLPGFEDFSLYLERGSGLSVLGTPGPDDIVLTASTLDLHLGDGPDSVFLDRVGRWNTPSGAIDLGRGKDSLVAGASRLLAADLARGFLVLENSDEHQGRLALLGLERFGGGANRVEFRGGPAAEKLSVSGCHLQLRGGSGHDRLTASSDPASRCSAHVAGGAGRDRLNGGAADDRLLGGPGNDEARGRRGTDTCRAEREVSCER